MYAMKTGPRLQGGWSLASMIVVAAIAVTALGIGAKVALDSATRSRQESAATQQAHEMRQLAAAASAFVTETLKDFVPDVPRTITVQALIDGGKLPPEWARRWVQAGETPLGQRYEVRAILPASNPNTIKILVGEAGASMPAALSRLSLPIASAETEEAKAYKRMVSRKISVQQSTTISGMLISPATKVVLEGRGEVDVSELFGEDVTVSAATILLGFPELGQTLETCPNGNCPRPAPPSGSNCRVVTPVAGVTASCPVGYENMGSWPHCDMLNTNRHNVYGTRAGPVTIEGTWMFYKFGEYVGKSFTYGSAGVRVPGIGMSRITGAMTFEYKVPRLQGCLGPVCKFTSLLAKIISETFSEDGQTHSFNGMVTDALVDLSARRGIRENVRVIALLNAKTEQTIVLNTDKLASYGCGQNNWEQVSANRWVMTNGAVPTAYQGSHPRDILCCI